MKSINRKFPQFNQKGFTLVEVIIAIAIIGIIGTTSWFGISAITQSEVMTGNRVGVVNLMQLSQEEVRSAAQSLFDTIQFCDYQGSAPCGFDNSILANYPDVTNRILEITETQGSELKTVRITVEWQERGILRQMDSVTLLARPPDPLPGNLVGVIRSSNGGAPINNVNIRMTYLSTNETISERSSSSIVVTANGNSANYNFDDDFNGKFRLKPGKWNIKATRSNFLTFTNGGQPIDIISGEESGFDFVMEFSPPPTPQCGDGKCNGSENCNTCSSDCGACPPPPVCGDGKCNGSESCGSCAKDCGSCPPPPVCGDGKCNGGENCSSCAKDCGVCPPPAVCGDGKCNGSENCSRCAKDCGACPPPPGAQLMDKCDDKFSLI